MAKTDHIPSTISALFKIIGVYTALFTLYVLISQILILKQHYYNLFDSHILHIYWHIGSSIIGLVGSIGLFFRKKWAWIGFCFFLILEMIKGILMDSFHIDRFEDILVFSILSITLIILLLKNIRSLYNFSLIHLCLLIGAALTTALFQNNIKASPTESVSNYYISDNNNLMYFEDSLYTGRLIENDQHGNLLYEGPVVQGKMSGKWIYYSENGLKWIEESYYNGYLDGPYYEWYPNFDVLKYEGQYTMDQKNGIWKEYEFDSYDVKISSYYFGKDTLHQYINLEDEIRQ